ncbi:cation:proton antiporter [Planctomycetales bacterium ZRK34]|nr:cation:proton antiporter [Planctomycetales bacterium ZRK34]
MSTTPLDIAKHGSGPSPRRRARWRWLAVLAVALLWPGGLVGSHAADETAEAPAAQVQVDAPAAAEGEHAAEQEPAAEHSDPVAPVLLGVIVLLLAARVAGHLMELVSQPAVLGELTVGIILGNLTLLGIDWLEFLKVDYSRNYAINISDYADLAGVAIDMMARIGVVLLLFQVGLETSMTQMKKVGASAMVVAIVGVVAPLGLGFGAGFVLLPDEHWALHLFLGATLCATSVGITARVLQDLKKESTPAAQVILGAAVIDDVLGLIILALVEGIISAADAANGAAGGASGAGGGFSAMDMVLIITKAGGFLIGALIFGQMLSRHHLRFANYLRGRGLLVVAAIAFCFALAWLASFMGLAPIVGAFAAGLLLDKVTYHELADRRGERELEEAIRPVADLLVPIFFVMMGIQVDVSQFADPSVLMLAGALTVIAIIGKQVCGLGVLQPGADRMSIGLGMIPRGEVGLIFAAIGRELTLGDERVINPGTYGAIVLMVILTTMVTPPLLKWSLLRHERKTSGQEPKQTQ